MVLAFNTTWFTSGKIIKFSMGNAVCSLSQDITEVTVKIPGLLKTKTKKPLCILWQDYFPLEKKFLICYWTVVEVQHLNVTYRMTVQLKVPTMTVLSNLAHHKTREYNRNPLYDRIGTIENRAAQVQGTELYKQVWKLPYFLFLLHKYHPLSSYQSILKHSLWPFGGEKSWPRFIDVSTQ